MKLRPYQQNAKDNIRALWCSGTANVLEVLPTGAGKTVLFADIVREEPGASCVIAHRQELVGQISLALARNEIEHRIIGPTSVVRFCVAQHVRECGRSYYNPNARAGAAGVDTLIRRGGDALTQSWLNSVKLWVMDEAHHVLRENKWGAAVELFPKARGLGVTATPLRADGKGLGKHADGVFGAMDVGPSMRDLINQGFLTEYRVLAPPSDIQLAQVSISKATGDFNQNGLRDAVKESSLLGDVVEHYLKHARGKLGVTFVPDIATADLVAAQFVANDVPARVVSAKTPAAERAEIIDKFRRGEYLNLVNVDLFGEGFDLPAIEVVSMARPTQSYSLYVQQFGRALRLMEGKERALIIDHAGNVMRHNLPDMGKLWTLDSQDKRARSAPDDVIPVTSCDECMAVYERIFKMCPECGHINIVAARSAPAFVSGDLVELDAPTLEALRSAAASKMREDSEVLEDAARRRVPRVGQLAELNRHKVNRDAQEVLRELIAWWAGVKRSEGMDDSEAYRRFYFKFGVDVMGAQALNTKETEKLINRIQGDFL